MHVDPNKIVCGYRLGDLMIFADACRKAGVENADLLAFCLNVEAAWAYAYEGIKRAVETANKARLEFPDVKTLNVPCDLRGRFINVDDRTGGARVIAGLERSDTDGC